MPNRSPEMRGFLDACLSAFEGNAHDAKSVTSLANVRAALARPGSKGDAPGLRLPFCDLPKEVAQPDRFDAPDLRALVEAFHRVEPGITWWRRGGEMSTASENIADGHANGVIVGPQGIEQRDDVMIGATLMAPHVRYPDHTHPPEETYLVLSAGEFRHGSSDWFTPGMGGSFYNEPGITHAMRSHDRPLFAFWTLWAAP